MKAKLFWFPSTRESWLEQFIAIFDKKINFYLSFEIEALKVKKLGRESAEYKVQHEEKLLLSKINSSDFVILFDEKSATVKNSYDFSNKLVKALESSKQRVVFVIGGAFGLGEEVKKRANLRISLSNLTLSHQVATVIVLEQIFRALTIWKNHPYHND
ncbi:MAG: 23S rRNA (pseudouridine(1915)-N(3))-methyltransferase RlmH [Bdellovibrionales bacterium]|nr:23S rRNA (pseudouridine(1915)-N(3))-methyltransferase RlmH [Bdellovibrionales bacterium]